MKNKATDENVIQFPRRSEDAYAQSKEQRNGARSQEQLKQTNAWFRRAIEAKFSDKSLSIVHSKQERIRLANNLWQIFADLRPIVSTKEILRAAGHVKHETDSTKRLPYFALDPNHPEPVRDKRAEKLTKSIKKYTRIVAEAARLSGKDESDLIRRFVAGTRYSPLLDGVDAPEIDINLEAWTDIATAIQTAATRISSKYNLPRFFKLVHDLKIGMSWEQPVRWDTGKTIFPPELVDTDRLPLHPSIYLGEIRVCEDIPCTLIPDFTETVDLAFSEMMGRDFMETGQNKEETKLYRRLRRKGLVNKPAEGVATPVLRASLELLPLGRQNIVTPVLRLESRTHLAFAKNFTGFAALGGPEWTAEEIVDGFDGPIEEFVETGGGPFLAAHDAESDASVYFELVAEFKSDVGAGYANSLHSKSSLYCFWILPFDDSARICLSNQTFSPFYGDKDYGDKGRQLALCNLDFDPPGNFDPEEKPTCGLTWLPPTTMAALLERSLFHAPESARLDHLLDENTRILTQELDERIEQSRARRRERLDELRRE
jgi:hypothetical protein